MKNLNQFNLSTVSILLLFIFTTSCSNETIEAEDSRHLVNEDEILKTSGGSCGTNVNFKDLVVETSWLSGDKGDRDTFSACGVDGENWMDKYNSGIVMMKCLKGDGHRTELKEATGDEASLGSYKKMEFTARYTNLAENGVTIAQIHNRGSSVKRPWIRVYIDDDRYVKIKETETNPTGSRSSYSTYKGPKYTSGKTITVTVWTGLSSQKKAKIEIKIGEKTWTKTLSPSNAWRNKSNTYYLKAGVYTEGNNKTCTVKYSNFKITH